MIEKKTQFNKVDAVCSHVCAMHFKWNKYPIQWRPLNRISFYSFQQITKQMLNKKCKEKERKKERRNLITSPFSFYSSANQYNTQFTSHFVYVCCEQTISSAILILLNQNKKRIWRRVEEKSLCSILPKCFSCCTRIKHFVRRNSIWIGRLAETIRRDT